MKLLIGNPTGHHDQHQCTLVVDGFMVRGAMPLRTALKLDAALSKGCRATGQEYSSTTLSATRRKNEAPG